MSATGGWQPIETAPRDGTTILVWADGETSDGHLMRWRPEGFNPLVSLKAGLWEHPTGGYTWSEDRDAGPTHWRPLS